MRYAAIHFVLVVVSLQFLNAQWLNVAPPGGSVASLAAHQDIIMMGMQLGSNGLWRSTDQGITWTPAPTDLGQSFGVIAIASDGSVLYATHGSGGITRSVNDGIDFVSSNEGLPSNFSAVPLTVTSSRVLCGGSFSGSVPAAVNVLASSGDTLYAATSFPFTQVYYTTTSALQHIDRKPGGEGWPGSVCAGAELSNFGSRISDLGFVEITIFDIRGGVVKTIVSKRMAPGTYTASWDGTNDFGQPVASGVYFYRLAVQSGNINLHSALDQTRKMLLVR